MRRGCEVPKVLKENTPGPVNRMFYCCEWSPCKVAAHMKLDLKCDKDGEVEEAVERGEDLEGGEEG